MLDNIIVAAIIIIAAVFIGRRYFKQFTAKEAGCNCSGCGQAGSCSGFQDDLEKLNCSGQK